MSEVKTADATLRDNLLASAVQYGALAKVENERAEANTKDAKARKKQASDDVDSAIATESDFGTPCFVHLAKLGALFGQAFNDRDSDAARDTAMAMARTFGANMTGKADESGGTYAGYARMIQLGEIAEHVVERVQSVVSYYRQRAKETDGMKADEAKLHRQECERYFQVRGETPNADGSLRVKENESKGTSATVKPRHIGRPETSHELPNGQIVRLEFQGATNRRAQMAGIVKLVHQYGTDVLTLNIIRAYLDTGGKWAESNEKGLTAYANDALTAIESMRSLIPAASPDNVALSLAFTTLLRLAKGGAPTVGHTAVVDFDSSTESAPAPESVPAPESAPEPENVPAPLTAAAPDTTPAKPPRARRGMS